MRMTPSSPAVDKSRNGETLTDNDIKKAKKVALKHLHRTLDPESGMHQTHVCVICDCYILGTQNLKMLDKKQFKVHKERLSIDKDMSF